MAGVTAAMAQTKAAAIQVLAGLGNSVVQMAVPAWIHDSAVTEDGIVEMGRTRAAAVVPIQTLVFPGNSDAQMVVHV